MNRVPPAHGPARFGGGFVGRVLRAAACVLGAGLLVGWCHGPTPPDRSVPAGDAPEVASPTAGAAMFPVPDSAAAWESLPPRVRGEAVPLPAWARVLARPLPRTTAAMLELDHAHRAGGHLDPKLRAQVRWAAARAHRCGYGEAYALADLRAAGADEAEVRALTGAPGALPEGTRETLAFVHKLATAPHTVTDEEVARLTARYGERQAVGVVLGVAYAGFLDRLVLALGLSEEPGGVRPPADLRFARLAPGGDAVPPRTRPAAGDPAADAGGLKDPDWRPTDLARIQSGLETQKARAPRIALPAAGPLVNRWGLVGRTYQPALATAWATCAQAFAEEADQDPVFEQSVFWIVTRTKQCFY